MKIISNQENRTHLSEIIQRLENADEIIFCVAFLKISGLHILTKKLKEQNIKCTFYIGTDFYLTEPKALMKLYEDKHKVFITKKEKATYHPKIFYFKKGNDVDLIIGSTNLTNGGLEKNIEASFSVSTTINSNIELEFKELLNSLQKHSELIDNLKPISDYEKRYLAYRNRHKKADEEFEIDLLEILKEEEQNRLDELLNLEKNKSKNKSSKLNNIKINDADKAEFSQMLEKYIYYTTYIRKSTAVNKNHEDKELVRWYQRMKELIKHEAIPDDLAFRLIDANFPFENAWGDTIKMYFDKNFKMLLDFKEKEQKHLDYTYVLQTKKKNSPYLDLGRWIAQQKQRRKGQNGSAWTDYEEEKMQSINYMWERPELGGEGGEADDEGWWSTYLALGKYYEDKRNYKTSPPQSTYIGHWLSDQRTLKNKGIVGSNGERKFLNKFRERFLEKLLLENGLEWKWQEQLEREKLENGIKGWQELVEWEKQKGNRKSTDAESKYFKKIREWNASTKNRSKKWDREKEKWKIDLLTKAGFPLPKIDEQTE
jgi:HKD family nuclease